jgi:pimeloyl-ACP methyl ester carboxylesterase
MAALLLALALLPIDRADAVPAPAKPGVIFVVGGAGGIDLGNASTRFAFQNANVPHEIREFLWTHGKGNILRDLQDTPHLVAKANELTRLILDYKAEHPERPVYLIGRSTGAAIVLLAAGQLPDASLEKIILLASAVSPAYNLVPALRATRSELIAYRSDYDNFMLGWGTRTFGTADRVYTDSAGKAGFYLPAHDAMARLYYLRLVQVSWKPRLLWTGHYGAHLGVNAPLFLMHEVAPRLQLDAVKE